MKHCPFCRRDLELDAFPPDSRYVDGHSPRCSSCSAGEMIRHEPELLLGELETGAEPLRNEWVDARRREWLEREAERLRRKRNPEDRMRARHAVRAALRRGDLRQKPCQYQFDGCKHSPTEFHHVSYAEGRELEGKWACKVCHDQITSSELRRQRAIEARLAALG